MAGLAPLDPPVTRYAGIHRCLAHGTPRVSCAILRQKRQHFWQTKIDAEKSSPHQLGAPLMRCLVVVAFCLSTLSAPNGSTLPLLLWRQGCRHAICYGRHSTPPPLFRPMSCVASFQDLKSVCVDDVVALIRALPDKSCASDPLPTTSVLSVGPFHRPKPNPTHQITDPTQPIPNPTGPNPHTTTNKWPGVRRYADARHHHNHHQNALISMQISE